MRSKESRKSLQVTRVDDDQEIEQILLALLETCQKRLLLSMHSLIAQSRLEFLHSYILQVGY